MQTPKSRASSSSNAPQRTSPRASLESPRKDSPRSATSDVSEKVSPRVVRQLKRTPRYSEPTDSSSNLATRASKGGPKLVSEKKNNGKVGELESQISVLKSDLQVVKDQLSATEELKKQAQLEAEESNQKLLALSLKLIESQRQLFQHSGSLVEAIENSEKHGDEASSSIEDVQEKNPQDSSAMAAALDEVKKLKAQLEMEVEAKAATLKESEDEENEIQEMKQKLSKTLLLVEDMKNQLREAKESELQAQGVVGEISEQLEMAKEMVETLKLDGIKASETYDNIVYELERSKAHADSLEELVKKLEVGDTDTVANEKMEMEAIKIEVEQLRTAVEAAEIRYKEEQVRSSEQARNAVEMIEKIKAESSQRETELELELRTSRKEIDELKANLMDKETELQGICEENEALAAKLEKTLISPIEFELEKELQWSKAEAEKLRALLMEKEALFKSLSDENEKLKLHIEETIETSHLKPEIAGVRLPEGDSFMKISLLTEEVDKSNKKAARVAEQLEAAQAAKTEIEAELRRVKVQSNQWRKAAEAAAAMISAGNNGQLMERTGSMGSHFSSIESQYVDDLDDELRKKKNSSMLTRLWRKPQK